MCTFANALKVKFSKKAADAVMNMFGRTDQSEEDIEAEDAAAAAIEEAEKLKENIVEPAESAAEEAEAGMPAPEDSLAAEANAQEPAEEVEHGNDRIPSKPAYEPAAQRNDL